MRKRRRREVRTLCLLCAIAVLSAIFFNLAGSRFWLGKGQMAVDVNSGRVRTRVFVFGRLVSTSVTETRFSEAVARLGLRVLPEDYRFANSIPVGPQRFFGTTWAHGAYGHMLADLNGLMRLFETFPEMKADEREIIEECLTMLRAGDRRALYEYVYRVGDRQFERYERVQQR